MSSLPAPDPQTKEGDLEMKMAKKEKKPAKKKGK